MKPVKLIKIVPSKSKNKKYDAYFLYDDGETRKVDFGAKGYLDFTITKNPKYPDTERRKRYITRHQVTEGYLWRSKPDSPAALSRWILWEEPDFDEAVEKYRTRFRL